MIYLRTIFAFSFSLCYMNLEKPVRWKLFIYYHSRHIIWNVHKKRERDSLLENVPVNVVTHNSHWRLIRAK